ncbi:pyrroline-5-carboxylate reductase [Dichotomocladium elegans]|nr:pyrroline-5-carboxylate reductase [Dichotomocladium elegans]
MNPTALNTDSSSQIASHHPVIAFIGAGNMAEGILGGLYASGHSRNHLRFADPVSERRDYMTSKFPEAQNFGDDNNACIKGADVVILAVKPQVLRKVVQGLVFEDPHTLIISIAAGIRTTDISRWLNAPEAMPVVRCMPNTPALIGEGAAGLYATEATSAAQRESAERILSAIAKEVNWVDDENLIDTITAVSGSGPAYFFLFMEAMQAAGVASGLTPEVAKALTMQTCIGAAKMAQQSEDDLAVLRRKVTSPHGTTEAALVSMENANIRKIIEDGVFAAEHRSRELAEEMGKDQ